MVILDLGLPDMDGLEVIRRMRGTSSTVPIIVLSSRDDEGGKVEALDLGADDYVTKPFGIDELFARVRAALRHRLQQQGERPLFRSGDLVVDLVRRVVTVRGAEVKFSPREYDLLRVAGRARRQGADPPVYSARGLGRRDGRAVSTHLYPGPAAEDRGRSRAAGAHPDRNRRRLSAASTGLNGVEQSGRSRFAGAAIAVRTRKGGDGGATWI